MLVACTFAISCFLQTANGQSTPGEHTMSCEDDCWVSVGTCMHTVCICAQLAICMGNSAPSRPCYRCPPGISQVRFSYRINHTGVYFRVSQSFSPCRRSGWLPRGSAVLIMVSGPFRPSDSGKNGLPDRLCVLAEMDANAVLNVPGTLKLHMQEAVSSSTSKELQLKHHQVSISREYVKRFPGD